MKICPIIKFKEQHHLEKEGKKMENKEFESKINRIYEMRDEMENALENMANVKVQQNDLIQIIRNTSENVESNFEGFINALEEQNKDYDNQKKNLETRLSYLYAIIDVFENRKDEVNTKISNATDIIVTYLLSALGA